MVFASRIDSLFMVDDFKNWEMEGNHEGCPYGYISIFDNSNIPSATGFACNTKLKIPVFMQR